MVQTFRTRKEKTMTNQTEMLTEKNDDAKNLPTHIAKTRNGFGKKATYERIGVAWENEDGSFYVKLYGTQVVSNFTLYEIEANGAGE
jgi:hypothetical protein